MKGRPGSCVMQRMPRKPKKNISQPCGRATLIRGG
jgi:hypothetical protein